MEVKKEWFLLAIAALDARHRVLKRPCTFFGLTFNPRWICLERGGWGGGGVFEALFFCVTGRAKRLSAVLILFTPAEVVLDLITGTCSRMHSLLFDSPANAFSACSMAWQSGSAPERGLEYAPGHSWEGLFARSSDGIEKYPPRRPAFPSQHMIDTKIVVARWYATILRHAGGICLMRLSRRCRPRATEITCRSDKNLPFAAGWNYFELRSFVLRNSKIQK
jgi:hypothetical protein